MVFRKLKTCQIHFLLSELQHLIKLLSKVVSLLLNPYTYYHSIYLFAIFVYIALSMSIDDKFQFSDKILGGEYSKK